MAETQKRNPHSMDAIAVGTLVSLDLEQTKPKEGKQQRTYLKGEIAAAGSKIRFTIWPSSKKPTLPQDLHGQFGTGQKVSARGNLEEQVNEDGKLFRGLRAWGLSAADAHEEDKLVYHIAGHLGRLEKTGAGELVAPITYVRQYEQNGAMVDQESTLRVCPPEQLMSLLYNTVRVGQVVRARGDIVAKMNFDRFGLPSGEFINRLEVALLEVWDEQKETWNPLKAGAPTPTDTAPVAPASQPSRTIQLSATIDEDDVPF